MVTQWFYLTAERQQSGPIDSKELRRLAEAGIVRPDTLVRQGDTDRWVRAEQVRGLFQRTTSLPSSSMVKATPVRPPAPPPLPPAIREFRAPSGSVGGESPIRHGRSASAVNEASEKRNRIHPSTLVAIIASTGFVLLLVLLLAVAFRGGGEHQQAEKDQLPLVVSQSAESKDTVVATPGDGLLIANAGDSSVIASQTSQSTANEARVIRDPATLFENSRIAVATILTKDCEGYDSGQGSGFFINTSQVEQFTPPLFEAFGEDEKWPRQGYLITNYHVIRAAASAKVRVHDFGVQLDANIGEVVMEREDLDLALVSVSLWPPKKQEAPSKGADGSDGIFDGLDWGLAESKIPWWKRSVPTLEIADRGDPVVGTKVYAIGSPQGLEATFSEGIVSGYRSGSEGLPRLQFSAAVSPGSSGGPLVDEAGQVVGVVTALRRGGQNLNFAVPASEVCDFLKGQCNSRELWRGTSIDDEADAAQYAVLRAMRGAEERKKYDLAAVMWVVDVDHVGRTAKQYRERLETLLSIEPSSCGDFEYLLYYARGKASRFVATIDIFENRAPPVPKSERNLPAQQQVALQLKRSSDHQAGIRFLKQALQLNPKFPPTYWELWSAYSMSGQHSESLQIADTLALLVPHCSKSHQARGSALKELGQFNMALEAYQTAAELSPANPSYYASLGKIYDELDVHDKAIEAYEASIRLGDASDDTCMQLAFSLQKAGRFSEAIVKFQEARAKYLAWGIQEFVDICDRSIAECRAKKRP